MAKTYADLTVANATAGNAILASDFATLFTNSNNYRVPPMARINLTSDVSVAASNSASFTGFTSSNASEVIDTDGMVTLSATASAITIQTAGVYACYSSALFTSGSNGQRAMVINRSRSGTLVHVASNRGIHGAGNPTIWNASGIIECDAGDLIRLRVFHSDIGAINLGAGDDFGSTFLAAHWVGQVS